jgi:hypothetical protein
VLGGFGVSNNPVNLALRFLLELAALAALGYWGWVSHDGVARWLWTVGLVVGVATVWGVFRVPGDGGPPVIAVPGWVRLLIEAAVFCGATAAIIAAGHTTLGVVFGVIVVVHYAVSYDRVVRFLRPASP